LVVEIPMSRDGQMSERANSQPKEHYRTLDVSDNIPQDELERQYQRLRKLYQPENVSDADARSYAAQKLAQIEEAYAVLGDPARRAVYDGKPLIVAPDATEIVYCANHPATETLLRCNKCGKPICIKCARQTPVGYRCNECIHQQQNVYFNALGSDNFIALGVGFLVSAIAAPVAGMLLGGFGFFGLIIAFVAGSGAGSLLAQIIRRAVGRRRGTTPTDLCADGYYRRRAVRQRRTALHYRLFPSIRSDDPPFHRLGYRCGLSAVALNGEPEYKWEKNPFLTSTPKCWRALA
jgi:hypothetical protein